MPFYAGSLNKIVTAFEDTSASDFLHTKHPRHTPGKEFGEASD